jgi:hypothetical protein
MVLIAFLDPTTIAGPHGVIHPRLRDLRGLQPTLLGWDAPAE